MVGRDSLRFALYVERQFEMFEWRLSLSFGAGIEEKSSEGSSMRRCVKERRTCFEGHVGARRLGRSEIVEQKPWQAIAILYQSMRAWSASSNLVKSQTSE